MSLSSLQAAGYLTAAQQAVVQANAAAVARSMAQLQQQQRAFAQQQQQQPPPSAHGGQQPPAFRGGSIMTGFPRYPAASTSRYGFFNIKAFADIVRRVYRFKDFLL